MKSHECCDCRALPPSQQPPKPRKTDGKPRAPRCYTHALEEKKRIKAANRSRHVKKTYGLSAEDYKKLLEFQNGKCALCQRATGQVRALAVDHDHDCCPGPVSCGKCTRGLLCKGCNFILIHRYSTETMQRAIGYLGGDNPATRLRAKGGWPAK